VIPAVQDFPILLCPKWLDPDTEEAAQIVFILYPHPHGPLFGRTGNHNMKGVGLLESLIPETRPTKFVLSYGSSSLYPAGTANRTLKGMLR